MDVSRRLVRRLEFAGGGSRVSPGYLRPLWLPPEEELLPPPGVPPAPVGGPGLLPGIPDAMAPAAPAYEAPEMQGAAPLSFRDRLGLSLAGVPQFSGPLPQESGLSAFARGLVGGVGSGMATSTAADLRQRETARTEKNAAAKSESDRNYVNAIETWKPKLAAFYKTQESGGNILVTKQMEDDLKLPPGTAGRSLPVLELATKKAAADKVRHEEASNPLVPITEEAVAKWLGAKMGDLATRKDIADAHKDMKPGGSGGGSGVFGEAFDPYSIAQGIHEGTLSANPSDYTRGAWNSIVSILHTKYNDDVNKFVLQNKAIRQSIQSMNQPQMASYRAAMNKVVPTIDYTEGLIDQLDRLVPTGMMKEWNTVQLAAVARGKGDWVSKARLTPEQSAEAANLATQILGQISGPVETEMGTVYTRGAALTDEGRKAVRAQISANMGTSNMKAAFRTMRRDVAMASTALDEVSGWSPFTPRGSVGGFDMGNRRLPAPPTEHDQIPDR